MSAFATPWQAGQNCRNPTETGGGATPAGGTETRVVELDVQVAHIRRDVDDLRADVKEVRRDVHGVRTTDFRLMFGAIIVVALGLASLMAKGFHWI